MTKGMFLRTGGVLAATLLASTALAQETISTQGPDIAVETVTEGLSHPWGLAFLPDGSMLVTERYGNLRHVTPAGDVSEPISGLPEVDNRSQGGLLDVTLDPDFEENRLVYWSYAELGEGGTTSTAVARGKLSDDRTKMQDVEVIFSQEPKVASSAHYGSRLVFDREGHLFVTLGERFSEAFRGQAQELDSDLGKIVRLNPDGSIPNDNPYVGRDDARPEIWSYGHRNVQAAAINPGTGELWEIEHGPKGGDELNIARPGENYGWPIISYGVNYNGTPVGSGKAQAEGMAGPLYQWTPVIAPSGMVFYEGDMFPEWQGDIFVGGLASQALVRLDLDGEKVTHEERLLHERAKRIRDVVEGPDGALYLLTDEANGAIWRLHAGKAS
ncbi:PQQ-dependent sugar dehydrogenase [Afifella marina]|uniref:Glucose/arabinose dehydrogenase, beta-propeller fold n=1 Tax=Afifella marina DSM 2698 TaxID=1120955 RepID=A0A1G5P5Q6_AFIMA|nr:PQQ-dependent sugar dehydrogenase [Afifella marina]SCZ44865.1 Glucose/arabinose dehydrogenase, beta-propeller fold [Afifella marina DSM 2698]